MPQNSPGSAAKAGSTIDRAPEPPGDVAATPPVNTDPDRWTIGRLLVWTSDFLKKKGSESPRLDAEVLLAHALKWPRVKLYTHYEETIGEADRSAFRDLVRRRADGAPVAYLVGRKEFYALAFTVTPAVLIPRADSEFVVLAFLELMKDVANPRAVDVGTGSGCLALACASRHPGVSFTAIDISREALDVARGNAESLKLASRVTFRQGTLLDPVANEEPFDAIISNPPYISTSELARLEKGVRDFEPILALDGGPDGLRVFEPLIDSSRALLKPGGHLILEIGSSQDDPVRSLIDRLDEFELAPTIRDHAGRPRVIRATRRR